MINPKKLAIIVCFAVFLVVTVHHFMVCGRLFDLGDMLHHEFFSFILLAFGVGLASSCALEDN